MAVLGEPHSEGEPGVDIVHLNTRVSLGVVGWNLENRQLSTLVDLLPMVQRRLLSMVQITFAHPS